MFFEGPTAGRYNFNVPIAALYDSPNMCHMLRLSHEVV